MAEPVVGDARDEQLVLAPLFEDAATARSQDLPELFCPTGAVWWARAEPCAAKAPTTWPAGRAGRSRGRRGVDIDTEADWEMARC